MTKDKGLLKLALLAFVLVGLMLLVGGTILSGRTVSLPGDETPQETAERLTAHGGRP